MKFIPSTSTNKGLLQSLYKLVHLGRHMGTLTSFPATCKMGIRFYNFLFAFLSDKALPEWGLPVCLPGKQSLPKMGSTLKGKNLLQMGANSVHYEMTPIYHKNSKYWDIYVWANSVDSDQTVLRSSLIRIYTVCHSVYIFWRHYCIVKLNCFILRTTMVVSLGVPIFRVFTVYARQQWKWQSCFPWKSTHSPSGKSLHLWEQILFFQRCPQVLWKWPTCVLALTVWRGNKYSAQQFFLPWVQ